MLDEVSVNEQVVVSRFRIVMTFELDGMANMRT